MNQAVGIDCGTSGTRLIELAKTKDGLKATHFFSSSSKNARELSAVWAQLSWKPASARIGLTGKDLILRYSKVPPVPDAELRNLMTLEIEDIASQSGDELCADFNLLPLPSDFSGEDTVLLALAKNSLLEPYLQVSGLKVDAFSPNAIGLFNAYLRFGNPTKEMVLIVNLGEQNVDMALVGGSDLYFARNVSGGGKSLTDGIASRFGIGEEKAESLKRQFADLSPQSKGKLPESSQQEKVTQAVLGAAGAIPSLIQSTLMFCKAQTKLADLKISKILLCGGSARLKGLPEYLSAALKLPVSLFDPFEELDRSSLSDAEAEALDAARLESVAALGLAAAALDDTLYSLEILPDSIKKKREFASKTVYLAAAAAALVLFLGFDLWTTRARAQEADLEATRLNRLGEQRKKTDKKSKELLEGMELQSKRASWIEQKAGGAVALTRSLRLLEENLPPELWIQTISVELRSQKDEELKTDEEPVPIVRIEGKGREGVGALSQIFQAFTEKLRSKIPHAALKQTVSTNKQFSFSLELNYFAREDSRAEQGGK